MAEESDRVEGFIYLADCFDGFAGGVDRVIEMNQDDYHRRSLLFSFDEPEPKATPFSLVSKSLALQSQADLIIPLWLPQSTSTDEQCTALSSVISNVCLFKYILIKICPQGYVRPRRDPHFCSATSTVALFEAENSPNDVLGNQSAGKSDAAKETRRN